jgi:hypothetical protein
VRSDVASLRPDISHQKSPTSTTSTSLSSSKQRSLHSTRPSPSFKTNAKMRTLFFIKLVIGIAVCLFALASHAAPVRMSSLTRILRAAFH